MPFQIATQLGPRQALTPQGFLVCQDVPIARSGLLLYAAGELGPEVRASADGIIRVTRSEEEVFSPATVASFEHNALTIDHPEDFVLPRNWRGLAVGLLQNIRRGLGVDADMLLGDLLVTDQAAIDLIRGGQREVSCGYDADYVEIGPGQYAQVNLRGNHLALVERGRCGPRCAIGDSAAPLSEKPRMPTPAPRVEPKLRPRLSPRRSTVDRLFSALRGIRAKDAEGETGAVEEVVERIQDMVEEQVAEAIPDAVQAAVAEAMPAVMDPAAVPEAVAKAITDALAPLAARLDVIEAATKPKEEAAPTTDAATVNAAPAQAEWQDTVARAEILAPGLSTPTRDAAAAPKAQADALCGLRRRALDAAFKTEVGKRAITPLLAGAAPAFGAMTCDAARTLFIGASELVKSHNNAGRMPLATRDSGSARPPTAAAANERNRAFWAGKR